MGGRRRRGSEGAWTGGRPPSVRSQLDRLERDLTREHPEVIGIGIGPRVSRGRMTGEQSVRVFVREKVGGPTGRMPAGVRRLPKRVSLWTVALGQPVRVTLPVDVHTPARMDPTQGASAPGVHRSTIAALARWTSDSGTPRIGVVACAHDMDAVGQEVGVQLEGDVVANGRVVERCEFKRAGSAGLDVSLVRVHRKHAQRLPRIGPFAGASAATVERTIRLISEDPRDTITVPARFFTVEPEEKIRGVAYLRTYPIETSAGEHYTLRDVVECTSNQQGTFRPGRSGSAWSTRVGEDGAEVLALQSHANANGTKSAGTHFGASVAWLRRRPGMNGLAVAWTREGLGVTPDA
jgi:hypothetical protein